MKTCYTCQTNKEENLFNKNKSKKDGLNNICRDCSNLRSKKYYSDNKIHHRKVTQIRKLKFEKIIKEKIIDFLKKNPCVSCGESNLMVLDFDHLQDKTKNVAQLITEGYSWENVKKEIDKCQVLCSNCHRIKTHTDLKSYKWKAMQDMPS